MPLVDITDVIDITDFTGDHDHDHVDFFHDFATGHSSHDFATGHSSHDFHDGPYKDFPPEAMTSMYDHHLDCDTAYQNDPIQNGVCNISESHGFMDDTRECLIDEKAAGVGAFDRHLDCWGDAIASAFD